jgi:hypothetical protein
MQNKNAKNLKEKCSYRCGLNYVPIEKIQFLNDKLIIIMYINKRVVISI